MDDEIALVPERSNIVTSSQPSHGGGRRSVGVPRSSDSATSGEFPARIGNAPGEQS